MQVKKDIKNISIVVFSNRRDYFFTKICISSIRYYYPDIEILLVKDKLNGNYNTSWLRKTLHVRLLKFDHQYFGPGASKLHFILRKDMPKKRYLLLDSDIIFMGRVLDEIVSKEGDFVVTPEGHRPPFSLQQKQLYIDPEQIIKYYPDYEYPGFFFNAGQMIVTPGLIPEELIQLCFNQHQYPYFKDWDVFQTVDQSILNGIIPVMMKRHQLTVDTCSFMRWSVTYFEKPGDDNIQNYLDGNTALLLHYCGDVRTYQLDKMKGKNLLNFFKQHYVNKLSPLARFFDSSQDKLSSNHTLLNFHKWRNDKYLKFLRMVNLPV